MLLWLAWLLAPILTPFLLGALLAYVLEPLVHRLHARLRLPRALAALLLLVLSIATVLGVLLLVVPILGEALPLLREAVPRLVHQVALAAQAWLAQWGVVVNLDTESLRTYLSEALNSNGRDLAQSLWDYLHRSGGALMLLLGHAFLTPVVAFFLMADWPLVTREAQALLPPSWRPGVASFMEEVDRALGQYLHGQVLVVLVLMVYYCAALGLAGVSLWLPLGLLSGLAVLLPYVGFATVLTLTLVLLLAQHGTLHALAVVAPVYGLGQALEGFFLTPKLVGRSIGLHPVAVIFALLAFGSLAGFAGVLLALPLSAVLLVAVRRARVLYEQSELYR